MSFYKPFFAFSLIINVVNANYDHFVALDPAQKLKLYWSVNSPEEGSISFMIEAETTGWVGLGFTQGTGRMKGADIVIGWVKDGKPYLTDRHGEGHLLPTMDKSQDYKFISGSEKDGKTILKFSRKVDTCDNDDLKIEEGTTKLIFAYSEQDPISENKMTKHTYKFARSMLLLTFGKKPRPDPSWKTFDILMNNITIPSVATTYWCRILKLPDFGKKTHIVRFDPIIQAGNEGFVHHFVISDCVANISTHLHNFTGNCYDYRNMPGEVLNCRRRSANFAGWGVGAGPFVFPGNVGYPVGTPGQVFVLEIHYDNPQRIAGQKDNSGARFYYTSKVRRYDAGSISVGPDINPWMVIPPKQENWITTGYCKKQCTQKLLESTDIPGKGIKIIASFLHTHLAGRAIWTKHVRNGKQLPDIARDNYYDFNFQEMQIPKKEIHFKPGDEMIHQCRYNTMNRDKITYGSAGTQDEMCVNFITYYPRIDNWKECFSTNYAGPYKFLGKYFPNSQNASSINVNPLISINPKWTEKMVQDLKEFYENETHVSTCSNNKRQTLADYLKKDNMERKTIIDKPYSHPPSRCNVKSSSQSHHVSSLVVIPAVISVISAARKQFV